MVGTGEYGFKSVGKIVVPGLSTLITTVLATAVSPASVVVVTLPSGLGAGIVPETILAGHSTPGRYNRNGARVGAGGAAKSRTSRPRCTSSIYDFQIIAGNIAP